MFEGIRSFIAELVGSGGEREFDSADYRKAAAAILVHVADSDGAIDPRERARIIALLSDRFDMPQGQAKRLLAEAQESEAEAVDLHAFIGVLKRTFDEDGRLKLVEMMWELAYADGVPLEVEDSIVARVAQMLEVSDSDLDVLRRASAPGLRGQSGGSAS